MTYNLNFIILILLTGFVVLNIQFGTKPWSMKCKGGYKSFNICKKDTAIHNSVCKYKLSHFSLHDLVRL